MRKTAILVALVLAGCGGTPAQEPEFYLLRSDAVNATSDTGDVADISLGDIWIASYINRSGIVVETANGTFLPARFNLWAEPLREGLRTFLADEISSSLGRRIRTARHNDTDWREYTSAVIDLQIRELHGTSTGEATLAARWAIVDPQARSVVSEHDFSGRTALTADGYPALVAAEKQLLSQLADAIAQTL
jgi:hypothetical protein